MPVYLGDTEDEARARATREGTSVKIVCRDGERLDITFDSSPGRIYLELDGNRVVAANEDR